MIRSILGRRIRRGRATATQIASSIHDGFIWRVLQYSGKSSLRPAVSRETATRQSVLDEQASFIISILIIL